MVESLITTLASLAYCIKSICKDRHHYLQPALTEQMDPCGEFFKRYWLLLCASLVWFLLADREWLIEVNMGYGYFIPYQIGAFRSPLLKRKPSYSRCAAFSILCFSLRWSGFDMAVRKNTWFVGSYPEEQNHFVLQSCNRTVNAKWRERTKPVGVELNFRSKISSFV